MLESFSPLHVGQMKHALAKAIARISDTDLAIKTSAGGGGPQGSQDATRNARLRTLSFINAKEARRSSGRRTVYSVGPVFLRASVIEINCRGSNYGCPMSVTLGKADGPGLALPLQYLQAVHLLFVFAF